MRPLLFLVVCLPVFAVDRNVSLAPYSASCGGVTDGRAGVQAAIAAAVTGDRVVVPAGCMVAIGTTNQDANPGLQLSGKTNVQLVGLGAGAGFRSLAMTYACSQQAPGISHGGLLKVSTCTNCRIEGLEFDMEFHRAAAVVLTQNSGTIFNLNYVHDVGTGGTSLPGANDNCTLSTSDRNDDRSPSAMLQATNNDNSTYSNNTFIHARGSVAVIAEGTRGMWFGNDYADGAAAHERGATITGNSITDTWHSGIVTFCEHCLTSNNTVFDAGTTSVNNKGGGACQKDNYGATTAGTIINNDYQFCGQGVQIERGGNLIIQDNYFHNLLDGGVMFSPSGFVPNGNHGGNVQILHNTFTNVKHGVQLNGAINITVKNNTMNDDGAAGQQRSDSGMRISPSLGKINTVSFTHNNVGKNLQAGILFNNSGFVVSGPIDISNNSLSNSSRYGIDELITTSGGSAPAGITQSGNCFFSNTLGSIHDARSGSPLGNTTSPLVSGTPCPSSLEGALPVSITTTSLPGGQATVVYTTTTLVAANGTAPYTWTATPRPAGISVTTGGVLSGTPTTAGTTNVVITVTDALGGTATKTLPIVIAAAPPPTLAISTASFPSGQATVAYSTTLVGSGGTAPYTWTATPLPPGLSLSGAVISGIPTTAGSTSVVATVTDSASPTPATAQKTMAIAIAAAPLQVATASLPDGQVSVAYSQTLVGVGGVPPYTWTATPLPAGITLSSGVLSGVPTAAGTTSVVITVTDSVPASAQRTLSLVVAPAPVQTESCPDVTPGVPPVFVQQFSDARTIGQTNVAFNMPSPSVAGNTLVCYGALSGISNSFVGFTSRAGEAFTQVTHTVNGQTQDLWVLPTTAGSGALVERVSLEVGVVSGQSAVVCMELANAANQSGSASTSAANSTNVITGVTGSAVPDSILIAGMAAAPFPVNPTANGSCASTTPANWITVATPKTGTAFGAQVRYAIVNSSGNYCHSWSLGATAPWVGAIQSLSQP